MPSVGWPAKGISLLGVKIRVEYELPSAAAGNVVSEKPNSCAIARHCAVSSCSAPCTTASWFPAKGRSVKTSTTS